MNFYSKFYAGFLPLLFLFAVGCSSDNDAPPRDDSESETRSPFASISAVDGSSSIDGSVDTALRRVLFSFESKATLDSVALSFALDEGVTLLEPALTGQDTVNLTQPLELTFERNGYRENYTLSAETAQPFASAELIYSYYPVKGIPDRGNSRIDFPLELCTTDAPDISRLPVVVKPGTGYTIPDAVNDTLWVSFSETGKSDRIFLEKGGRRFVWRFYVNVSRKTLSKTEFRMNYGTNLCYWFQEDPVWTREEDIRQVKQYGFDHVRLPFDSKIIFDETGAFRENHLAKLHHIVQLCLETGLNVVLDLHWLRNGNGFPNEAAEKELIHDWTLLKEEMKRYPNDRVAYEILNEPYGRGINGWYPVAKQVIALIRSTEPERLIFLSTDGYEHSGAPGFDYPKGDPNIVMAFHYYAPMLLTHAGLLGYTGPVHYPGLLLTDEEWDAMSEANQAIVGSSRGRRHDAGMTLSDIRNAATYAEQHGVRVHCGEFGCSKTVARADRLAWFTDIVAAFKATGMPYTCWETFGGDFGPGTDWGTPDPEVISILIQQTP